MLLATILQKLAGVLVAVLAVLGTISLLPEDNGAPPVFGGVTQGNEYNATSTAANSLLGGQTLSINVLKTGQGSLGSVVITGADTGVLNFYNATTTNVNLRTGQKATTTILIASFPASTAAGTYVFDAVFTDGLLYSLFSGSMPTTTVMWR